MSSAGVDEQGNGKNNNTKKVDISDYISTIEDIPQSFRPTFSVSPNSTFNKTPIWARPFSIGGGIRRPSSIRSLVDRQNIDTRIFQHPPRIASQADAIREASLMRTASTIATVEIFRGKDGGPGEEVIALRDPYDHLAKLRFENAYRADPVVRRCIDVLSKFVMGKRTHFDIIAGPEDREEQMLQSHGFRDPPAATSPTPSLPDGTGGGFNASPVKTAADFARSQQDQSGMGMMPAPGSSKDDEEDDDEEDEMDMIEAMFRIDDEDSESPLSEQELRELHRFISEVNRKVKFHERVKAALTQAYVYGRAVLLMETDKQGVPTELKLLNSKKLETVYVDPQTWKLVAVDYADRPKEEPLLAKDIIYFANQDYHISPDTLYYGLSRIEPITHVSETNQLLDEIDLKEGARSMWAGSGVIQFPPDTPDELVEEFVENFYPGTWNATSQNVQIATYNLKLDYIALTNARVENDRRIIRGLGIPGFLVGFENISNRATAEEVMISWHESELDAERTWLQDILEPQYFDYLIGVRFPDLIKTKKNVRIKLDFQNISFETLKEKAEAVVPLFDRGLATPEKALEVLRWQDQTPAVLEELARRKMEQAQLQQAQFELQKARAQSYLLSQTQNRVEESRRDKEQSLTAQAALQNIAALQQKHEDNSVTKELELLQMKLMREAHQQEADLRIKKAKLLEDLTTMLKKREAEAN